MIRLLIADDHEATRAGIRLAVEGHGFTVCASAEDSEGAVDAALRERPAVCLLDVNMPGSGIVAAQRIVAALPETAVVMLTVSQADDDLFAALRAGACGYLLKDIDSDRLPHALRGVLAGEAALPRTLVARVVDEFRRRGTRRLRLVAERGPVLTEREWEVLERLREGDSTAEIASRLGVSPTTVRRHVSGILRKLHVPDRAAAVRTLEGRSGD